jgi:uncharacterized protein (DUF2141 family)
MKRQNLFGIKASGERWMMNKYMTIIFVGLMAFGLFVSANFHDGQAEDKGQIMIIAEGFKNREGKAVFVLFRRGENWLDIEKAYRKQVVDIEAESVTVTFDDVPYDTYAVNVIHDKNENGKMDMRWFPWPKPKEGAGVSNNNIGSGPPSYDKAKFILDKPLVTLFIRMKY